jgi:hypothetical protein
MPEGKFRSMQAKWRLPKGECLAVAQSAAQQIHGISANRETQMPQVQSNLVCAAGEGTRFQQSCAIEVSADDAEFRAGGKTIFHIDLAGSSFDRLFADRRIAEKSVLRWMSRDAREVGFFNFATLELWLHKFGKMSCAGENNQTCRIGIQPVPPSIASHLGVMKGILVADVLANTPAQLAGIRPTHRDAIGRLVLGDIIVGINGHSIKNYDELYHLLTKIDIGAMVTVTIIRENQSIDLKFKTIDIGAY